MSASQTYFDVDASILFQLGESLITDEVQALIELIKNAYDADATYVVLTIDSFALINNSDDKATKSRGYILIEDNGTGMDETAIKQGWLTVSSNLKRNQKRNNLLTKRGRVPLGDKGLGRLGVQRLGNTVEILTHHGELGTAHRVAFSWESFRHADTLGQVPITFEPTNPKKIPVGTQLIIIISDLQNIEIWRGNAVDDLEVKLSQMISPFQAIRDFQIVATVDGRSLDIAQISEDIRDTSQVRYFVDFNGDALRITGKARLDFLRPNPRQSPEDYSVFRQTVEADRGSGLLEFLSKKKRAKDFHLKASTEDGWFAEFSIEKRLNELDKVEMVEDENSRDSSNNSNKPIPANPGAFYGEVDSFDFDQDDGVLNSSSEYKKYIQNLSGVRVYRDGFGIRVGSDWLGLGQSWTKGGSWYGLKPANTMGYVLLSALTNSQLEETTDREGFKNSPYYTNFFGLLKEFVKFANEAQELLRRGWNDYKKKHNEISAGFTETPNKPEALSIKLAETLAQAASYF
jgi:hypothetical protein